MLNLYEDDFFCSNPFHRKNHICTRNEQNYGITRYILNFLLKDCKQWRVAIVIEGSLNSNDFPVVSTNNANT